MNILLIYPYFLEKRIHSEEISVPPLGIYYVGAVLREHGYPVDILNWHDAARTEQIIDETLERLNPDIIGFSILHANRWGGIEISRKAKAFNPDVKTVFGGIGATFLWHHLMSRFREIDFTVIGEGEYAFLDLVRALEKGDPQQFDTIPGIVYRQGQALKHTRAADPIQDLDRLPMPSKYFDYRHVAFTRGCPGNCTFCGSPRFWGPRVRSHSPKYFVDQLEQLIRRGINHFYFSDDTFTYRSSYVIEICRMIVERNLDITWAAISRVNYISADILTWMRRAGCTQISYGIESGSRAIRNRLNKNISIRQVIKAFELTQAYGIMARAYFIYGSPGETDETIQATIDLIHAIKPLGAIFYILDIFPGTQLYADFKSRMQVDDDIWLERVEDILYFENDPDLTKEMVLAFGKRLRTDFYRHLPEFAAQVSLVQDKSLDHLHADFLSRLAMTFSHGDYAGVEAIPEPQAVAEDLYKKALFYHPDHRAFLGLGMLYQKQRKFDAGINTLEKGLARFPDSFDLCLCQALNHMNTGDFKHAITLLEPHEENSTARDYIARCYEELGRHDDAAAYRSLKA